MDKNITISEKNWTQRIEIFKTGYRTALISEVVTWKIKVI